MVKTVKLRPRRIIARSVTHTEAHVMSINYRWPKNCVSYIKTTREKLHKNAYRLSGRVDTQSEKKFLSLARPPHHHPWAARPEPTKLIKKCFFAIVQKLTRLFSDCSSRGKEEDAQRTGRPLLCD
jgi:hypothetical protein